MSPIFFFLPVLTLWNSLDSFRKFLYSDLYFFMVYLKASWLSLNSILDLSSESNFILLFRKLACRISLSLFSLHLRFFWFYMIYFWACLSFECLAEWDPLKFFLEYDMLLRTPKTIGLLFRFNNLLWFIFLELFWFKIVLSVMIVLIVLVGES